jgi:2-dehydro-3-deoxygluconokinase
MRVMTSTTIVCLGECMIELSERPDGMLSRAFGGDTLNTAVYLARLGARVDYATALGSDPFSEEMLAAWTAEGVGTGRVLRVPGRLPGLYLIQTDAAGERRFSYWRDSAPVRQLFDLPGGQALAAALAEYGLIYLSGITVSLFRDSGHDRLFGALDRARAAGARIAFDLNYRPRGWPEPGAARATYVAMLERSDIVLAGLDDHAPLGEAPDPEALGARLRHAGVAEVVLRLAEPACLVFADGVQARVAAAPVADVVDTTAAGDSFAAGYLAARLAGRRPEAAAAAGHRLAGAVIRHRGAIIPREAMPEIAP